MRLASVTIQSFRNFVAPQTVDVEPDVTVLVGKNESGKTTILKALHRLNPANLDDAEFDLTTEYPRWRLAPDRRKNEDLAHIAPVSATFALEEGDCAALAEFLPADPPAGSLVRASRLYTNECTIEIEAEFATVVAAAAGALDLGAEDIEALTDAADLDAVIIAAKTRAKELKQDQAASLRSKALTQFAATVAKYGYLLKSGMLEQDQRGALWSALPRFFYFSSYQNLPGECDLADLAAKITAGEALTPRERTVVALLAHAGEKPADFLDEHYDSRKAELQAASMGLSRHVFEYWRQNTDLSVIFDTDNVRVDKHPQGGDIMHRFLKIELRDGRHGDVETNFETRSTGFRWFFSFFAAFSEYQESSDPLVVLLDEPGTSLHGDAQRDFVRFINEELGLSKQTLYTTHSQHMIDPTRYENLRAVHDRATREDPDLAVAVTRADLSADRDTILPFESALGYSVSQHLFIGSGQHLAVEGSSDYVYLQRFTEHLLRQGGTGLDRRLAVIPVGGADNMPAFVALMGRRLSVSALVDGDRSSRKFARITAAAEANGVPTSSIVVCADADPGLAKNADIEDLFELDDYLKLYNWAFGTVIKSGDLPSTNEPVIRRLEQHADSFDHALPAHALTERHAEFFGSVKPATLTRFNALFGILNATVAT